MWEEPDLTHVTHLKGIPKSIKPVILLLFFFLVIKTSFLGHLLYRSIFFQIFFFRVRNKSKQSEYSKSNIMVQLKVTQP